MDGVDPETLLEWLQTGAGEERDLQLMALEQLCMLLLMSDNIDRCFESCPPRTFLPALGKIFLDETAPENILEVTARAITYYLDVSNECTRRITQVEGAVKAICNRLVVADLTDRTSKDLAEQCVKLLEHICQREASAVYDAGGLQSMLHLICLNDQNIHKKLTEGGRSIPVTAHRLDTKSDWIHRLDTPSIGYIDWIHHRLDTSIGYAINWIHRLDTLFSNSCHF